MSQCLGKKKKNYLRGKNILPRQKRAKSMEAFTATWKEDGMSTKQEQHQRVGERLLEVGHANTPCSSSRGRHSQPMPRNEQSSPRRTESPSPRPGPHTGPLGSQPCAGAAGGTGEQRPALQAGALLWAPGAARQGRLTRAITATGTAPI